MPFVIEPLLDQMFNLTENIMALTITESCINCGYCVQECPNHAIYEPGMKWSLDEGTTLKGKVLMLNGESQEATQLSPPLSNEYYFIVPDKCAECSGVFDRPQCEVVCPDPDSFRSHPLYHESKMSLMIKQTQINSHLLLTDHTS